jgi:hypothetical protein
LFRKGELTLLFLIPDLAVGTLADTKYLAVGRVVAEAFVANSVTACIAKSISL